jgi:hypothetical protein
MVKNIGDHNASRLVKIQLSTPISKFRVCCLARSIQATSLRQQSRFLQGVVSGFRFGHDKVVLN